MRDPDETKILPLADLHEAAGARFGPFAGWRMPLTYPPGVMKEHLHTREGAGLFDISHMRLLAIEGAGAADMLSRACPFDAAALETGHSKYTMLLDETAGIIDDVIVTRLHGPRFMLVANAGNAARDEVHMAAIAADFDCSIAGLDRVFLALQGPDTEAVMAATGLDLGALTFMTAAEPRPEWFASRSGYTGEDGFEVAIPVEAAHAFAEKLLADERVMWVGLGARDSLRLEAGLCLHGQDLDETTDPANAALMWAIPKPVREAGRFVGAGALARIQAAGPKEKRVGLKPDGRQPIRAGAPLLSADGEAVGRVTSGGFGPSAGHPVAMGYVARRHSAPGTRFMAEVRGKHLPIEVHPLPFVPHRQHKTKG